MNDVSSLLDVFDRVKQFLREMRDKREKRLEDEKLALKSLQDALIETRLYLAQLQDGKRVSRKTEASLARLWSTASVSFWRINPDLAPRLELKAEYWTNPKAWTKSDIQAAGIQIDEISAITRDLLGETR